MQLKIELKRGKDNRLVEALLVNLEKKHTEDYANDWVEQLRRFNQGDKYWDWLFKLKYIANQENLEEKQNMYNCGQEEDYDNLVYFEYGALRRK